MVCIERPGVARMLRGMKCFGRFHVVTNYKLIKNPFLNLFGETHQPTIVFWIPTASLIRGTEHYCLAQTRRLAEIPNHYHLMNASMYQAVWRWTVGTPSEITPSTLPWQDSQYYGRDPCKFTLKYRCTCYTNKGNEVLQNNCERSNFSWRT